MCLGKYNLLEDIFPPNAWRGTVIMATRVSNWEQVHISVCQAHSYDYFSAVLNEC